MGDKGKKKNIGGFDSVTARYFLEKFCGVSSENAETMNHAAIKDLLPSLKRTSYAHVLKNPELVATRQVIIVSDVEHKVVPYIVPENPLPEVSDSLTKKEKVIDNIVGAIESVLNLSESAILLIEGNTNINDYVVKPKKISDNFTSVDLASNLIEGAYLNTQVMINFNGKMYVCESLRKNINESDIDFLTLVSIDTDLIIVDIEQDGFITVIVDGNTYSELDLVLLQKTLEIQFDITKENEKDKSTDLKGYRLEEMSTYELVELMNLFKHSKQNSYYNKVRRELNRRMLPIKEHRIKKAKEKIKDYGDE